MTNEGSGSGMGMFVESEEERERRRVEQERFQLKRAQETQQTVLPSLLETADNFEMLKLVIEGAATGDKDRKVFGDGQAWEDVHPLESVLALIDDAEKMVEGGSAIDDSFYQRLPGQALRDALKKIVENRGQ